MSDIGAKVYQLAMNSSVCRELLDGGYEWIHAGIGKREEFVKLEDYEISLRRILELEEELRKYEESQR